MDWFETCNSQPVPDTVGVTFRIDRQEIKYGQFLTGDYDRLSLNEEGQETESRARRDAQMG